MNRLISPNFQDIFEPNIEVGTFPDGDTHVRIPGITKYENRSVTLFHRLYPNQNSSLIELVFLLDALRSVGAKVTVVAPYLPYARQDKARLEGEVISAEVICNLIAEAGCDSLITFDCHFLKKEGEKVYGKLKIINISMSGELMAYARQICDGEECEAVAPDQGASYLVEKEGGKAMKKTRRDYKEGKISYRDVEDMKMNFEVKGKNIIILDDMISTGSTMIKAIEVMKKAGAKKVFCAATHGFFLHNSLEKLEALADGVFVTDTIISPVSKVGMAVKCKAL